MSVRRIRMIALAAIMVASSRTAFAKDDYPRACNQEEANAYATLWYYSYCDWNYPTWNCAEITGCIVTAPGQYDSATHQCTYLDPCEGYKG